MKKRSGLMFGLLAVLVAVAMIGCTLMNAGAANVISEDEIKGIVGTSTDSSQVSSPFTEVANKVRNSVVGVNNYTTTTAYYGYGYGFGYWCQPAAAARFRRLADQNPKELEKLAKKLDKQDVFSLQGPEYARPTGHADDSLNHWYNRRSFSISCERNYDALSYSRELLGAVKAGYEFLMPYYEYFDKSYRMAD